MTTQKFKVGDIVQVDPSHTVEGYEEYRIADKSMCFEVEAVINDSEYATAYKLKPCTLSGNWFDLEILQGDGPWHVGEMLVLASKCIVVVSSLDYTANEELDQEDKKIIQESLECLNKKTS